MKRSNSTLESSSNAMTDGIYDAILIKLVAREIEPGERMVVDALARDLGVSQTPIRSALSKLEAQGLVLRTPLSGYRAAPEFGKKDFTDLYAARLLLEPKIAANAADNHSAKDLAELGGNLNGFDQLIKKRSRRDYNRFAVFDVNFHSLVASACANRFYQDAVRDWSLQLHLYRRAYNPEWMRSVNEEHSAVYDAIKNGDARAAEDAMRIHIENSYSRCMSIVSV